MPDENGSTTGGGKTIPVMAPVEFPGIFPLGFMEELRGDGLDALEIKMHTMEWNSILFHISFLRKYRNQIMLEKL